METNSAPREVTLAYSCPACGEPRDATIDLGDEEARDAIHQCPECDALARVLLVPRPGSPDGWALRVERHVGGEPGPLEVDIEYKCQHCGKRNAVRLDATSGRVQSFVDDCGVCCGPNSLRVTLSDDGEAEIEVSRDDE